MHTLLEAHPLEILGVAALGCALGVIVEYVQRGWVYWQSTRHRRAQERSERR